MRCWGRWWNRGHWRKRPNIVDHLPALFFGQLAFERRHWEMALADDPEKFAIGRLTHFARVSEASRRNRQLLASFTFTVSIFSMATLAAEHIDFHSRADVGASGRDWILQSLRDGRSTPVADGVNEGNGPRAQY